MEEVELTPEEVEELMLDLPGYPQLSSNEDEGKNRSVDLYSKKNG